MDIDAYVSVREKSWERLDTLLRTRRLDGPQSDELVHLYQAAAADLATLSSAAADPDVVLRLSHLVGRARGKVTGTSSLKAASLHKFFFVDLPLALYRIGPLTFVIALACAAVSLVTAWWVMANPAVQASLGTPAQLREYATEAFEAYYSEYAAPDFAAQVWTNNVGVALQAMAGGITGVYTVLVLVSNFTSIGRAGAIVSLYSSPWIFFALILPHGLMELTAIFISAAAGLRLFWALLVPGRRSRLVALAQEGRRLAVISVGLVFILAVAGLEEGFLTPSSLPPVLKVCIGALSLLIFYTYVIYFGSRAAARGESGDLEEDEAGYVQAEA